MIFCLPWRGYVINPWDLCSSFPKVALLIAITSAKRSKKSRLCLSQNHVYPSDLTRQCSRCYYSLPQGICHFKKYNSRDRLAHLLYQSSIWKRQKGRYSAHFTRVTVAHWAERTQVPIDRAISWRSPNTFKITYCLDFKSFEKARYGRSVLRSALSHPGDLLCVRIKVWIYTILLSCSPSSPSSKDLFLFFFIWFLEKYTRGGGYYESNTGPKEGTI